MATERSDAAHAASREASDKFDYFLTGVAGALAAYVGQDLQVTTLAWNGTTLELGALVCFAAAFLGGVRRAEVGVSLKRLNAKQLYLYEVAGASLEASQHPMAFNKETGEVYRAGDLLRKAVIKREEAAGMDASIEELLDRSLRWYRVRSFFLSVGVLVLVLARLLPAFGRP